MQVKVSGSNIEVGQSLSQYVEENLVKNITKYFDKAINADVHFSKSGNMFKVLINVNEGVKGGITVKSDAQAGDVYACFNEAAEKCSKQLARYKSRIKNFRRRDGGGLKSVEPDYDVIDAMKYIIPPLAYDVYAEMEEQEPKELSDSLKIVGEKNTGIESLSVEEAIMKMDLQDLPALVFINKKNRRLNVVYHRKDGNISWIDPKIS
ncbi:MAG: ribosome-associated translation inhibitor RaiA [Rickettsiales bacterium]|nr:ribosome-associated translation inhibitor RaiA [Rickettsiales bacterium]